VKPVSCLLLALQLADLNQEAEYTHSCFLEFWTAQFLSVSSSWFEFLDILILDTTFCFEFSCNLLDSARAFFVQGEFFSKKKEKHFQKTVFEKNNFFLNI
jgi:hypothetical protein